MKRGKKEELRKIRTSSSNKTFHLNIMKKILMKKVSIIMDMVMDMVVDMAKAIKEE